MRMQFVAVWCCAAGLAFATPGVAQSDPPSTQSLIKPGCKVTDEPKTKPAPASADGTAPGNAGSTGWSGGLGGSNIGTSQNGATTDSKSYQPVTARGLDPIATPPKPIAAAC